MTNLFRNRLVVLTLIAGSLGLAWLLTRDLLPSARGERDAIRTALAEGHNETALRLVLAASAADPASAELAFLRARCHRRLGQTQEFRRSLTLAANLGTPPEVIEREQTLMLAQQGQLSVASAAVSALLETPGDDTTDIYEALVRGSLLSMQLDQAGLFLDGWLADFPNAPQPWYYRGLLLETEGRWQPAADAFEAAVAKGMPGESDVRRHLADVLRQNHRYREALAEYERCDAASAEVLQGKAICLETLRDLDAARAVYDTMLDRFPNDPTALTGAGRLAAKRGEHAAARQLLERAVELAPSDVQAWRALAWTLVNLGETSEARTAFQEAVRLTERIQHADYLRRRIDDTPQSVRPRLELARVMLAEGRTAEGLRWLQSVVQIDPDNAEAREALQQITPSPGPR